MERERVAKTWIYRGLCDLFFAFHNDYPGFADQARFCEIMALEKFLKALLLYKYGEAYESKKDHKARKTINMLAKDLGHDFGDMLEERHPDLCRMFAPQIADRCEQGAHGFLKDLLDQGVFILIIAIERGPAHHRALGQLADGERVKSPLLDQRN